MSNRSERDQKGIDDAKKAYSDLYAGDKLVKKPSALIRMWTRIKEEPFLPLGISLLVGVVYLQKRRWTKAKLAGVKTDQFIMETRVLAQGMIPLMLAIGVLYKSGFQIFKGSEENISNSSKKGT